MKHAATIIAIIFMSSIVLHGSSWAGGHGRGGHHKHHHAYGNGWYAGVVYGGAPVVFGATCRPHYPSTVVIQQTWVYPASGPYCSSGYYYESSSHCGPSYPGAFSPQPVYYYKGKKSVR